MPSDNNEATPINPLDNHRVEMLLAEYERAQESAHHTDSIIHEITSIVWGANTLLIGFILEVDCGRNQALVMIAAAIGLFMTVYVPLVMMWIKRGQRVAYKVSREIEDELPLPHRLNHRIHAAYPKWRPGQYMVWGLTGVFVLAWIGIFINAAFCLQEHRQIGSSEIGREAKKPTEPNSPTQSIEQRSAASEPRTDTQLKPCPDSDPLGLLSTVRCQPASPSKDAKPCPTNDPLGLKSGQPCAPLRSDEVKL